MAKIDIAKAIVSEFPDQYSDAEQLKDKYTEDELKKLQEDLRKEASSEEKPAKKYRLRDPKTSYSEVGFTLAGTQEKELPENPSSFLKRYIKAGFIVEVD